MITLIRWYIMKTKEIKWKLAFWQFVDKTVKEAQKDPEYLAKLLMPLIAQNAYNKAQSKKSEKDSE